MPGKCAAPPAPAMITSMPRDSAVFANSKRRSGVRWAETIFDSCETPKSSSIFEAASIVGQSDLLPIMMATSGLFFFDRSVINAHYDAAHVGLVGPAGSAVDVTDVAFVRFARITIPRDIAA